MIHALALSLAVAAFGVEIPTIGITFDKSWPWTLGHYFSADVAHDIGTNLRADYVRTGWIPNWVHKRKSWRRENEVLDTFCGAGLHMMIIVPGLNSDSRGEEDLLQNVRVFFTRYTQREPGCIRYAEIANETNLPVNGFGSAAQYAAYYAKVAPIVASFGIPVITSGVSGPDTEWMSALTGDLRATQPPPPVSGYAFHPYGVAVSQIGPAFDAMQRAAGALPDGSPNVTYVTEMGRTDASDLYRSIVALAPLTPAITLYEYMAQPEESDGKYALVDHPALYEAARRAFADARADGTP